LTLSGVIQSLLQARRYDFDVERAIYLTVLHRLFASGSDRAAERWREDYLIPGTPSPMASFGAVDIPRRFVIGVKFVDGEEQTEQAA
jgi:hypothetical protein